MNNGNKVPVLPHLSPEMLEVLRYQDQHSKDAFQTEGLTYPQIRENYVTERRFWNEGGPEMAKTIDVKVPYEGGSILTRIHVPRNQPQSPCLFFLHGGGFTVGSVDTHDRIMRILAHASDCVVIGIDYSLSPEAKFPRAILECVAVTDYYRSHAQEYSIDPDRMGYAGDSGGATLSMATFLWQRDHREDTSYIKALLLYYGMFGLSDSKSMRLYGGPWDGLTQEDLAFYSSMYLEKPEDAQSPYACFYNNDLTTRMPACFIASCQYDPLIDDDEALYAVLQAHGVPCAYKMYEGTLHAFLHYTKMMQAANQALEDGADYCKSHI